LLATFLSPSLSSSSSQKQANKSPISKRISSLFPQVFALEFTETYTKLSRFLRFLFAVKVRTRARDSRSGFAKSTATLGAKAARQVTCATLYFPFFGYVINSIEVGLLFLLFSFAIFFNAMDFASRPGVFFFSFVILKVWRVLAKTKEKLA
jgi:hypothetical protein